MFIELQRRYQAPEGEGEGSSGGEGTGEGTGDKGDKGDKGGTGDKGGSVFDASKGAEGAGEGSGEGGEPQPWALAENIPGSGERPDWFKADKFKTVAEQAAAFVPLEAKIGPAAEVLGAPEEGYALPAFPEGVTGEWDTDDPMLQAFQTVAKELDLSQGTHDRITQAMAALLAKEEAAAATAISDALAGIGTNAPERIGQVETYLRATLGDKGYAAIESAIGTDVEAYLAIEQLVAKAGSDAQLSMLPGQQGPGFDKAEAEAERYKVYPEGHKMAGKTIYEHDAAHRQKVDGMFKKLFPGEDRQQVG